MLELHDVPLAPRTTFQLGGAARRLLEVSSERELADTVRDLEEARQAFVVLGGGSNVVVADEGLDCVVLQPLLRSVSREPRDGGVALTAAAGEPWDALVERCAHEGLAGIECLAGIPGWVGATPVQNVGAYGQEVAQTIDSVRALDLHTRQFVELTPGECAFAYRDSLFKRQRRGRYIISAVTFLLRRAAAASPSHRELRELLAPRRAPLDPRTVSEAVIELRHGKSMIVEADDPDSHGAGSFFTNPIVDRAQSARLTDEARGAGLLAPDEALPNYPAGPDRLKLAAAWLIEHAGFCKGYGSGPVGLSNKHVLAIVNRGGGKAREVLDLATQIQDTVRDRFGITLTAEPELLGFGTVARKLKQRP